MNNDDNTNDDHDIYTPNADAELTDEDLDPLRLLDENGLPLTNKYVRSGDVIIGKVHVSADTTTQTDALGMAQTERIEHVKDRSIKAEEDGYVDRIFTHREGPGQPLKVKIRMRQDRTPELGDKFASRYSQKGVVGLILPAVDMPFTADQGIVPDIIVNPNAFPSRKTVGHLLECLLAKTCAIDGRRVFCDTFEENNVLSSAEMLEERLGLNRHGNEIMYNSRTGEQIPTEIFIGPTYYMRLKHMVADKINHRSNAGPRTALTRQPNKGRSNHGGLRMGEMELQALVSHGASAFLKEAIMERSDKHEIVLDADSGAHAEHVMPRGKRIAPPGAVSLGGAAPDLRRVHMPYTFKLMQQELFGMGIGTKLVLDESEDVMCRPKINSELDAILGLPDLHSSHDECSAIFGPLG